MSNIGIFGGTFNPCHKGHERLLSAVNECVDFEKIFVLPDRIPPHKIAEDLASGEDRFNMCRLAFSHIENVQVSDWELNQQGKSFSVYTVRHFKELYSNDTLYFIMGSDMLLSFHKWYCYEEILENCQLICITRENDVSEETLSDYALRLTEKIGTVITLDVSPLEISSTQLRESLKKHKDVSCYLNEKVVKYIMDKKLYC